MTILTASGITKSYSVNTILDNISLKIGSTDKIGIVGVNGAGKTTLLKMISGLEDLDSGVIAKDKELNIQYMQQATDFRTDMTAEQVALDVFRPVIEIEKLLDSVNKELEISSDHYLIEKQQRLNESFINMGGLTYKSRVMSALMGLGLTKNEIKMPVSQLSGGQRTRVHLAKILLSGSGLLLLDEPTNHLDVSAIEWLEDFLIGYDGAIMVVSHDRFFLNRICNKIFETENTHLIQYNGNYTYYKIKKQEDRISAERDYESKKNEIKRIEGIIDQQKRFNQAHNYITIKSKQKQIDRIKDTVIVPEKDPENIKFNFHAHGACGNDILVINDLSKFFDDVMLFQHSDLYIKKGEKIFLTGLNGCGKSTLLKIITGNECATSGSITLGTGVKIGYYDQERNDLDDKKNVFEILSDAYPKMTNTEIRSALGTFLFHGDDVFKQVSLLSGGERARISLARLMLSDTNFLILDEPTNHLDIESKEVLETALKKYDGTLLAVSHDRYFVDKLADRIYNMQDKSVIGYNGNYSVLLQTLKINKEKEITEKKNTENKILYKQRKEDAAIERKKKKSIETLEKKISEDEDMIAKLTAMLQSEDISSDYLKLNEISQQIDDINADLEQAYDNWYLMSENN